MTLALSKFKTAERQPYIRMSEFNGMWVIIKLIKTLYEAQMKKRYSCKSQQSPWPWPQPRSMSLVTGLHISCSSCRSAPFSTMFLPQEADLWGLNQQPLLPSWLNIRGWEENAVKLLTPHQDPAQFPWIGWIFPWKATVPVRCPSPPESPLQIPGPTPPPPPFWRRRGTAR